MLFTVLVGLPLVHIKLFSIGIYMLSTASLGLSLAHIKLFSINIYVFYSLLGSVFSTYRVIYTPLWVHALYSLLDLSKAHMLYLLYASFEVSRAH